MSTNKVLIYVAIYILEIFSKKSKLHYEYTLAFDYGQTHMFRSLTSIRSRLKRPFKVFLDVNAI